MEHAKIIEFGVDVISKEISALDQLKNTLDDKFAQAVSEILACRGKVVITGIGKSGLIASKIASTLSSTGSSSFFVHPSEASHGDLGMITTDDLVIAISNSGESTELFDVLYYCNRNGIRIIAITKNLASTLGNLSDLVLQTPNVGDALAVTVSKMREFQVNDFHNFHPGGKLGKQFLKVKDIINANMPIVHVRAELTHAVDTLIRCNIGIVAVVDDRGDLVGVITDGDLRRNFFAMPESISEIMSSKPITTGRMDVAVEVLHKMNQHKISCVPICEDKKVVGFLHIHDCLKAGL